MSSTYSVEAALKEYIIETPQIEVVQQQLEIEVLDTIKHQAIYLITYDGEIDKLEAHQVITSVEENEVVSIPMNHERNSGFHLFTTQDWGYSYLQLEHLIYGSQMVRIGILDTGVDYSHSALVPYLEPGFTMLNDGTEQDDHGHGTKIAGIITNGSPLNVRIIPIKALNHLGRGSIYSIVDGMYKAIGEDIDILNTSFGTITNSELLQKTVQDVLAHNIQIIAAVGNYGGQGAMYPARYEDVIAVGSVNKAGEVAQFSQRGEGLDFVAPGEGVFTTNLWGGYIYDSGTSLSTGYLTKMVSALLSNRYLAGSEVKQTMKESTERYHINQYDQDVGYGMIDITRLNYMTILDQLQSTYVREPERHITESEKNWTITFSSIVDAKTITGKTITLVENGKVLPTRTTVHANTIVVSPESPYEKGKRYELYISNPIQSIHGKTLKEIIIQPFTLVD